MAIKFTDAFYRAAVLGVEDADGNRIPGLRSVAGGFTVADGYDMRQPLTRARKRRVVAYWRELQELTSQPKILFRSRTVRNLKTAQRAVGQDTRLKFNVAFVPFVPVAGQSRPSLKVRGDALIVKSETATQQFIPFNRVALTIDPAAEIKRVVSAGGEDAVFAIRAGNNMIKNLFDKSKLEQQITNLQKRYDGSRKLPARSKNFGDDPADHNWRNWLVGVESYRLKKLSSDAVDAILRRFNRANVRQKQKNKKLRNKVSR